MTFTTDGNVQRNGLTEADDDIEAGLVVFQAVLCNKDGETISRWWILLDNQSTVDVFWLACSKTAILEFASTPYLI